MTEADQSSNEDCWTPYKQLQNLVERYVILTPSTPDPQYHEFMEALRIHRQNFLTLMKNSPKNAKSREEIQKGVTEGITLSDLGHHILSKELVDETIIISDMYDLNEYMALDLLCTAQLQMPHHPGLTRGLTAILLYYDGRKALTSALRTLVQARIGHSWVLDTPVTLTKKITEYTNKLHEDGLLDSVLSLLEQMDPTKEQDLLQQNRALGGPEHHHMVMKLYNETRQDLADILYLWAAQTSLPTKIIFRLLAMLKDKQPESECGNGGPDKVTLSLIMALLYAMNLSSLHNREDGELIVKSIPLIAEFSVFEKFIQELMNPNSWKNNGLWGVIQLATSIAIATIKSASNMSLSQNIMKEDEILVEAALSNRAFHFITSVIFKSDDIYYEEFYIRYFHSFISDFITLMPMKVKELRSRADESMRFIAAYQQEGVEPPLNLDDHFEYLMLMVAELYKKDPLKLNLVLDYWYQHNENHISVHSRLPARQVALFKFVRLAGEILPAGLFVPYLKMIASLASSPQAARHAFNFLKPNGSSGSTISWDHFFNSLNRYYYNLRQELPPSQDTIYRQRNHPKGITPHEVKGLEAVLNVVQVVAKYDEMSRVAICDHPGWKVIPSLIGLVGCAMPIPLKGVLVRTLAALAKSPESSYTIWQSLEAAQILCTIPTTSSYQPRGVQTELEEIESRNEEYPLTRAMLELLDSLTDYPIPRLLGVGQRNPGFDPYLQFIINTVFLRFNTRSYKNPGEKWQVADLCLNIFYKLLTQYEPNIEDFVGCKVEIQGGESTLVNPEPGYHLMTQLHSNSELLHVILYILDEGRHYFETYEPIAGKKYLENSTLNCLRILEHTLKMQQYYMAQLTIATTSNKILTGLSKLLLGVNPRTGKPDHMINIAMFVVFNSWLKKHAYVALGVIQGVASEPGADSELLATFTSTPTLALTIRHGFVECLDSDEIISEEEDDHQTPGNCKDRILLLLIQNISRPTPNLAHYLLGFDITKDIRKTVVQQPGMLGFPRTCLHSILGILELSLERGRDKITEACYRFLHILAANAKTSVPVLRFLRTSTNQDFVQRHLSKLPFQGPNRAIELACMSWLLKIAAIELHIAGGSLQNSLVRRLVGNVLQDGTVFPLSQKLLMDLLHYIDFEIQREPTKSWEFFDPSQVEMVLNKCSVPMIANGGPQLIDIRRLHALIKEELAVTQSSATATQRKLMQQELQSILAYALKRNQTKTLSYATVKFVEGWCQATEMLFSIATTQQLPTSLRQSLLLNLSHDLLQKMTSCEAISEIKTLVSSTVLILLVNLKNTFAVPDAENSEVLISSSPSYTTTMKIILNHILQWIINSGASSQKVRTHLYGALLNFLCVVGLEKSESTEVNYNYVSQLDHSLYRSLTIHEKSHRYSTIQVINAFGDKLMDIVAHNCSGGHDVCKMLALSCLDKILELDCDNSWIIYLSSRGYLKHMIDSLLESDNLLRSILQPEPSTLRPLYLYEAKIATFCRMAASRLGAESLLESKILSCLSSMSVFDQHPDIQISFKESTESFLPSLGQRYQQILLPALYLCDALLTTLGTENQSCAIQVCGFIQSHRDAVEIILRNAMPHFNNLFLNQVSCLTGVIARSANIDMYQLVEKELNIDISKQDSFPDNTGMRELRAHLFRLQKLMVSLLSKFSDNKPPLGSNVLERDHQLEVHYSSIKIAANVLLYARNQMQHTHMNQKIRNLLFEPFLNKSNIKDIARREGSGVTIGAIVNMLISTTNLLYFELSNLDSLIKKAEMVKEMNATDLKKYLIEEELELNMIKQRVIVTKRLEKQTNDKKQNIRYCSFIVEHSLYILWSHLDYYVMNATSKYSRTQISDVDENYTISNEILADLKQGLVGVFSDAFVAQLLDLGHHEFSMVEQSFIEALIRRIKRLLQFVIIK
ncbi:nuclear pore complex protein Nup205 [Chelonus insularis]|uniref:nuclear pore complex protein Nup205 n=1 Tax=Chelonus insularis TaxID=460826 RepID=UPI00158B4732|nr:nuclear pore complex protein Nup205 [Chelonus insularis]